MRHFFGLAAIAAMGIFLWMQTHSPLREASPETQIFTSTGEDFLRAGVPETVETAGDNVLTYDPSRPQQEIAGFGGALSDSSLIYLQSMPAAQRSRLLREIFDPRDGLNFSLVRVPIGATDFGKETYSYLDSPGHFDFSRLKNVFTVLKEIRAINPALRIMVSPWSAPAWMKEPAHMHGGTLKPEHIGDFAAYIARVVKEYGEAGLPVDFVSAQNEPFHAVEVYPTMRLTTENQIALLDELHRRLRAGGSKAALFGLDHNYIYRQAGEQIWAALPGRLAGIAYHCYEGDVEMLRGAQAPFLLTECTDIVGKSEHEYFNGWLRDYVLAPGLLGAQGAIAWNLVLDEAHGPTLGPCYDCRPLVEYDRTSASYRFTGELKAIGQVSKFLRRGARRLTTESLPDPALTYIAYQNRDGGVVVVVQNLLDEERMVHVPDMGGKYLRASIPGKGAATIVIGSATRQLALDGD